MSEFKPYKTKWLKIDLMQNKKDIIVKRLGSLRQKSMDKKLIKDRIIPQFPLRMGSTTNSIDSDDIHESEPAFKYDFKSSDDGKGRLDSVDDVFLKQRHTTDYSSTTDKSSVNSKINAIVGLSVSVPKELDQFEMNEIDEEISQMPSSKIQSIPQSLRSQVMPPSPGNLGRFRSESYDISQIKCKREAIEHSHSSSNVSKPK
uniref:Uncharacterized protein n=1 Tax=Euplotes harpa TaxID=151035 RepID=A0A7S3N8N1_9SPIT|mmetsp:Transcript_23480/g.26927  ORF Transcript_23480/g.26927 Transcript_23480/m.26927 type:complete len:202 (+) Transcript_23480:3-608(+)